VTSAKIEIPAITLATVGLFISTVAYKSIATPRFTGATSFKIALDIFLFFRFNGE